MLGYITLHMDPGQYGILGTTDITDITSAKEVLARLAKEVLMPGQKVMLSQKESLMPMLISITLLMDIIHLGTLDTTGMVDTITWAKEVLMPSQKENLMPMLGSITLLMDIGLSGTLDTTGMVDIIT